MHCWPRFYTLLGTVQEPIGDTFCPIGYALESIGDTIRENWGRVKGYIYKGLSIFIIIFILYWVHFLRFLLIPLFGQISYSATVLDIYY